MKFYNSSLLILIIAVLFCVELIFAIHPIVNNKPQITEIKLSDGHDQGGIWKSKMQWKAHWVQHWETRKIWVPIWRKVWGPVEVKEWIPLPKIPPTWTPPHH